MTAKPMFSSPKENPIVLWWKLLELKQKLNRGDWSARVLAVSELSRLGNDKAVGLLIGALKDPSDAVRKAAAESLGNIEAAIAIEPLRELLNDSDRYVRGAAAKALLALKYSPKDKSELARVFVACEEWKKAVELGADAVKPLIARMKEPNHYVRRDAAEALQKLGVNSAEVQQALSEYRRSQHAQSPRAAAVASGSKPARQTAFDETRALRTLEQLCNAYAQNNTSEIERLEPLATQIGQELDRRGGIEEMRRIWNKLNNIHGARTLDMHWDGIGEWLG